jgi:hypothetical protein
MDYKRIKLGISCGYVDTVDNNNLWITLNLSTSKTITCGQCEQYCLNYQHGILYRCKLLIEDYHYAKDIKRRLFEGA